MSGKPVSVVFGAMSIGTQGLTSYFQSEEDVAKILAILKGHGVTEIDTAQIYGTSEAHLGQAKAGDQFTLQTKWGSMGFFVDKKKPWATKEYIVTSGKESLARLGMKQIDIFYLHFPDPNTPLEETLAGVDEIYRLGLFRRFGLSNYDAAGVQAIYDLCKANGYVLPSVYQGNYSAAARRAETELIPTLRQLGISFYAYSPLAGGLLTKTSDEVRAGKGRFDPNTLYGRLYNKPAIVAGLDIWGKVAQEEGVSRVELAYRWVASNSILSQEHGDAIIIGAHSFSQLEETLAAIEKGGLSAKALAAIDEFWKAIEHEAPLNNNEAF